MSKYVCVPISGMSHIYVHYIRDVPYLCMPKSSFLCPTIYSTMSSFCVWHYLEHYVYVSPHLGSTGRVAGIICGGFYGPYLYLVVTLGGLYLSCKYWHVRILMYLLCTSSWSSHLFSLWFSECLSELTRKSVGTIYYSLVVSLKVHLHKILPFFLHESTPYGLLIPTLKILLNINSNLRRDSN
jgi:hypothetical protein